MCGIVALYNNSSADISAFYNLWMEQEARGRDASGIFALLHDGRVLYAKAPVRATEFVPAIKDYVDRHGLRIVHAIAHTRHATKGSPLINRNNHPIVRIQDGTIHAIVHNGTVEINACSDSRKTFTDSEEILCAYISKGIDGVYNIARAHYIDSAFAIMAVGESGLIDYVIARFGDRPLHYLRYQDTLLFASNKKLKMKEFKRSITSLVNNTTIYASWKKLVCYACKETAQENIKNITGNGYVIRVDSSYYYYYTKITCIADNDNALKECRSILSEVYGCSICYER